LRQPGGAAMHASTFSSFNPLQAQSLSQMASDRHAQRRRNSALPLKTRTMKLLQLVSGSILFVLLSGSWQQSYAHGGVVEEADLCVIKIGYLKAHFKIYQPLADGQTEYCEDLPNATESIFVMEFLHDELRRIPVDFRIIHDVTGKGRFASWEDVAAIEDLDSATVLYRPATVEPDVFTAMYDFTEEGDYIGIVTVTANAGERKYVAVFPFEVGYTGFGYWPLLVGMLLLIEFIYLYMSGRLARWWRRKPG
jgi:hypothetical protein